jgi:hypothetical protein
MASAKQRHLARLLRHTGSRKVSDEGILGPGCAHAEVGCADQANSDAANRKWQMPAERDVRLQRSGRSRVLYICSLLVLVSVLFCSPCNEWQSMPMAAHSCVLEQQADFSAYTAESMISCTPRKRTMMRPQSLSSMVLTSLCCQNAQPARRSSRQSTLYLRTRTAASYQLRPVTMR